MLKQRLDKTAFDALPDVMKAEYKVNATNANEYLLDAEDAKEAVAARDREKKRADDLQASIDEINKKLADAEKAKKDAEDETNRKAGNVAAIEKSWQDKLDAAIAAKDAIIASLQGKLRQLLVRSKAQGIAAKISVAPDLLTPAIEARLTAELDAETPITRVLDVAGKPSALSIDDLEKEFVANPAYAAIIKANEASGGGAGGGSGGGGAPTGNDFSKMTEREKVALRQSNPEKYRALADAHKASLRKK